jgi:lysophospholipase L1-like esterase
MRLSLGLAALGLVAFSAHAQQAPAPTASGPGRPVGEGVNRDWANIERYRAANQALVAEVAPQRVVFMGDSITEGWAGQAFIRDNGDYVGRGISGQTSPQMLVRFRSDVIALKPAVVHIMTATNDVAQNTGPETPDEIFGYITSMVELARASKIKVVLASIPPAKDFPWRRGLDPVPKIRALNDRLKAYAAQRGILYVDYWTVLATPDGALKPEYSADGVHPNAAGFEAMRPLAETAIEHALKQKQW